MTADKNITIYKKSLELPIERLPKRFPTSSSDRAIRSVDWAAELAIQMELLFEDILDEQRLVRAFLLTLYAEPILMCRYVKHWYRDYFERINISLSDCVLVVDNERDFSSFRQNGFNHAKGPMLQCCLYQNKAQPHNTKLIVKISHFAADAKALHETVALFSQIYQKLGENSSYIPTPNISGCRSIRQIFNRIPWRIKFAAPFRLAGQFKGMPKNAPYVRLPFKSIIKPKNPNDQHCFHTRHINPPQTRYLISYAKERQGTLNDIFQTAFARAIMTTAQRQDHESVCTTMTVDLRRYLSDEDKTSISNLSGAAILPISVSHAPQPGNNFHETFVKVREITNRLKVDWIGIDQALTLSGVYKILPSGVLENFALKINKKGIERNQPYMFMTNLGNIKTEDTRFGSDALQAHLLVPAYHAPTLAVGVSGFNNHITFSIADFYTEGTLIKEFMDQIIRELPIDINNNN